MIQLEDKKMLEKIKHLRKAIEIVGGKEILEDNLNNEENTLIYILNSSLYNNNKVKILNKEYTLTELFNIKTSYEKEFLKNKSKISEKVIYKIREYNTSMESKIKKYKKDNNFSNLMDIKYELKKLYSYDIDSLVLMSIISNYNMNIREINVESFIGEYLNEKREEILQGILRKYGI
ncbi:hypothetical protein JCM1393_27280 [Clostridium carnis]